MHRVLVTERLSEEGLEVLRRQAEVDVRLGLPRADLLNLIPDYDAIIVRSETQVTADLIDAATNLLVIGRAGTGFDNIDVEAATRRGIVVVNAPEANTISAAEHTIGLMLAMARHIPDAHNSVIVGKWERAKYIGVELRGKTLGIIGFGRIGMEVARRARGLEMRVLALDPFVSPERGAALGVTLVERDQLLAESDILSVHVPITTASVQLLGEEDFPKMKDGVRVINASRGGQVSEAALAAALASGKVAGAALDVFETEPPSGSPLLSDERVIVTPHLGASTAEAQERVAIDVVEQILAVFRGEPAIYAVNSPFIGAETFKVLAPYLQAASQAASLATQLSTGQFEGVEIEYLGELADYDVAPLKAAVIRGLLAPVSEENVTLVNANMVAEQRGLRIVERKGHYDGIYNNLIRVHLATSTGTISISSTVAHDGPHIVEINDFWVDVSPGEGYLLLCENEDTPGMIGRIGTFLGEKDINISFMRVGREKVRGRALMVLGLDDEIPAAQLEQIARVPHIYSARTAKL